MTLLERFMEENAITRYSLMVRCKVNPKKNSTSWGLKLSGDREITQEEFKRIVAALIDLTGANPDLLAGLFSKESLYKAII